MRRIPPPIATAVRRLIIASFVFTSAADGQDVASSEDSQFAVRDIRIEGLQRITEGTVFNYLPVDIGDELDRRRIAEAIRALYATGFFRDVEMRRDGGTLIVTLLERPTIESFEVKGNKDIRTEDLQRALRHAGLATGKSFDRSVLDDVQRSLTEQYFSGGKYSVRIESKAEELPGNKIKVTIDIDEGKRAQIRQINIVGNAAFSDEQLLEHFQLGTPNWLSWYKQDDRYAKEALSGDLETLRSHYMDRGYADFEIVSNQVTIDPDKRDMFITVNVHEGEVYRVADVKLAGDLVVPESELRRLCAVTSGQTFSQRLLTLTTEAIRLRLGQDGYAFAKIDAVPRLDAASKQVSLSFVVDSGSRVYARRINFHGSPGVNDAVFRREARQLEGSYLSNTAVDRTTERIRRLPFIEKVDVETTPVTGTPDLVDVDFTVEEGLPGQFGGTIGYSEAQSLILGANIVHTNFLGTGQRVAIDLSGSSYGRSYALSHTEPYFTSDGVSRKLELAYVDSDRQTSASSIFSTKTWRAGTTFRYPISEFQSLEISSMWERVNLATPNYGSQQLLEWVGANGNPYASDVGDGFTIFGSEYDVLELGAGWIFDSRDRSIFPTRGAIHQLSFDITAPGSDVEYFVANYDYRQFFRLPFMHWLPFSFVTHIGYGGALGGTTALPPRQNFRVGGPGSLRGFDNFALGPRDSTGNAYGGDLAVTGQLEAILPLPEKFARSARAVVFYDFGQLAYLGDTKFTDRDGSPIEYPFDLDDFRTSVGIGVEWLAPMGLFRFSYALPLKYRRGTATSFGDEVKEFQFSMGGAF